jgi:lipid II:glycine glycyltransferase (peptidoglycan interpeptide bridge formation enzyme)
MIPHFLQSDAWQGFQGALGNKTIHGKGKGWSYLGMVNHDRFGTFVYAPYGPTATSIKTLQQAVEHMKQEAKKVSAYSIIIEPYLPITRKEATKVFGRRVKQRQALRTLFVDLTQTEEDIIANMSATRRKQYRNYHKKDIVFEKSTDIKDMEIFFELMKISADQKHFFIRDKHFFEVMAKTLVADGDVSLFLGKQHGKIEVAAIVYDDDERRYYAHVGRELSNTSLQISAPMIAYMIIDAKRSGKKIFDLYGISERDDVEDDRTGFTIFKRTFGGSTVEYAGAWELPVDPVRYRLKKGSALLRKILKRG